jgi:hypothetical protein
VLILSILNLQWVIYTLSVVTNNPHTFTIMQTDQNLYQMFMGKQNIKVLLPQIGNGVRLKKSMGEFAHELKIDDESSYDTLRGDITSSLAYINQLYLDKYGSQKDKHHRIDYKFNSNDGRYPKIVLTDSFNYNDSYAFRAHDGGLKDQHTVRTDSNFRYKNTLPRWQQNSGHIRMASENTGLRLGDFQEAENINRGYAMETILSNNMYNTEPNYNYDYMLSLTGRLQ